MKHPPSAYTNEFARFKLWLLTKGGTEGQRLAKWVEGLSASHALAWYAENREALNSAAPQAPRAPAFPTAAQVADRPVHPPTTDLRFVRFVSAHSKDEQGKQAKHFDAALNEEQAQRIAALTGLGVQVAAPKDRLTEILLTDKAAWVNAKLAEALAVEIIHYYPAHILDTETAAYVLGLGEAITAIPGMPKPRRDYPYEEEVDYPQISALWTSTALGLAAPLILEGLVVGPWDVHPEDLEPFSTSTPRSSGMFGGSLDAEEWVEERREWVQDNLLNITEGYSEDPLGLAVDVELHWPLSRKEVEKISGTALVARTLSDSTREPLYDKFTGEAISGDHEDYEATVSKLQGRPDALQSKSSPWDFFAASVGLLYITHISPYHWERYFGKEFSGASPLLESSTLGRTPEDGRWAVNKQAAAFYQSSRFAPAKPPEDGWEWLVYPRSAFAARGSDTLVYEPSINVGIGAGEVKAIYKALDRPEVREHGILVPFVKALAEHTLDKAKSKEDFFHLIDLLQAAHLTRWLGTSKSGSVRALAAFLTDRRRDIEGSRAPSWEALDNAAVRRQEAEIEAVEDEAEERAAELEEPEATEPAPPAAAPRTHTYGARNRPPGFATAPKGWTHFNPTDTNYPEWTRHGEVVYDRPLTFEEMKSYELHPKYTLAEVLEVIEHGLDDKTWRRVMQYWLPWHKVYQGERREGVMREVVRPILDNYVHRADGPLPAPEHARAYYDVPLTSLEAAVFEALERGIEARGGTKAVEEARAAMLRPGDDEDDAPAPPSAPPSAKPSSPFSVTVISDKPAEARKAEERAVEAEIARRLGGSVAPAGATSDAESENWASDVYGPNGLRFAEYHPEDNVWTHPIKDHRGQPATMTVWYNGDKGEKQASFTHVRGLFYLDTFSTDKEYPKNDWERARAVHRYLAKQAGWTDMPDTPTKPGEPYPYPLLPTVYAAKGFPVPPAVGLALANHAVSSGTKDGFKVYKTGGTDRLSAAVLDLLPQLEWRLVGKITPKAAAWRPSQDPPDKKTIVLPALAPVDEAGWLAWAERVFEWFADKHPSFKTVRGGLDGVGDKGFQWEVTHTGPTQIVVNDVPQHKIPASLHVNLVYTSFSIERGSGRITSYQTLQRVAPVQMSRRLREVFGASEIPEPFATWIENGLGLDGKE